MIYRDLYRHRIYVPDFIDPDDAVAVHAWVRRAIAESIIERRAETKAHMPRVTRRMLNAWTREDLAAMNVPEKLTPGSN